MLTLIKYIFLGGVALSGILLWQYSDYESQILADEEYVLEIMPGETFSSLLSQQTGQELFSKIYLRENTPDFGLQAGKYNIPENADITIFLESLKNPINERDISLTFLEGWNIFDIDEFLSEKGYLKSGEFIKFSENHNLESEYVFLEGIPSLEGYLYPDTYAFNPNNITANVVARKMLDNFNTKIFQGYMTHADNETIFELVTLASIVEKEERNPDEKSTVAGILKKRLEEGWMIGADITVCYPFRLTSEECKLSVTKYLYEKNDYNTRQKVGLPAGPIGNPSEQTFQATLYDRETDYYYYLHDTQTGKIYYGETNADHERNKRLYLR